MSRLILAIAILLLCQAVPASAGWLEARSRHFVVYSEGSPAAVQRFAADLERFDRALRILLDYPDRKDDDPNPVTVFVVDDLGAVKNLCKAGRDDGAAGCRYIAGFYRVHISGSVAFVPRRAGNGAYDLNAKTILFHEYAHHIMMANSGAAYPAWYREGFAEFVANVKLDKEGEVGIGLPAKGRAGSLLQAAPMHVRKLLTANPSTLSADNRAIFYARAWLLTHFLTFADQRNGQLTAYLTAINKGVPAAKAAEATFGDLDALDKEMSAYLRGNRFRYLTVPVPSGAQDVVRIRPLDAGSAAMMPIRIQSQRGVDTITAPKVAAEARNVAASFSDVPGAQNALVEAEFDVGDLDAADAAADRVLAAAPDNMVAMIYKARIRMRRAQDAGAQTEPIWREARKWLLKANRVQPDAAWPLYLYYQTFQMQGTKPTSNAADALSRAYSLVPQDSTVRFTLVSHLLAEEKFASARALLAPMAYDPHISSEHPALALLARIDAQLEAGGEPTALRPTTQDEARK